MKIVAWQQTMRLWILDTGGAILVTDFPEGKVGMEIECVDGKYRQRSEAQACET